MTNDLELMTLPCSSGDTKETLALSVDSLPDRRLFRSEAHLAGDRNNSKWPKVGQSRDSFLLHHFEWGVNIKS